MNKLVYYEVFQYINSAMAREKYIKGWLRAKKEALIDMVNPDRNNLFENGVLTDIDGQRTRG